jgi:hypothetical protein
MEGESAFWNGQQWVQRQVAPATVPMGPMDREPAFWNGQQWVQRQVAPATVPMGPMNREPAFWNGQQWVQRRVAPATDSIIPSTVSRTLYINNSLTNCDRLHLPSFLETLPRRISVGWGTRSWLTRRVKPNYRLLVSGSARHLTMPLTWRQPHCGQNLEGLRKYRVALPRARDARHLKNQHVGPQLRCLEVKLQASPSTARPYATPS